MPSDHQKPTSQRTIPEPGQVWKPTKAGSGKRIVCHQGIRPDANVVHYKTVGGTRRKVWLREWNEWVSRWRCEVDNHG